jgi:pimeloyl-ACP methyl ester carboxylesterase
MERIQLDGVDQWIVLRGRSTTNPVLLFLDGGPGGSELAWNRQYDAALEDYFVFVDWEQRGAGKSTGAFFADYAHMTPEQYVADGLQLTDYLRHRFGQDRIYLVGGSWGSMLGIWMAQRRPEWFAA